MSGLTPGEQAAFDRELAARETEPCPLDAWVEAEMDRTGIAAAIEEGRLTGQAAEDAVGALIDAIPGSLRLLRHRKAKNAVRAYAAVKGWDRPDDAPDSDTLRRHIIAALGSAEGRTA